MAEWVGRIFIILMIILMVLYWCDLLLCAIYCKARKKRDKMNREKDSNEKVFPLSERVVLQEHWMKKKLKQQMEGLVIWRVKRLGKVPCQFYRTLLLKKIFQMEIAPKAVIYGWDTIRAPWNIRIGTGSVVGNDAMLDGRNGIQIGENVNISTGIKIYTEQHDLNDPWFRCLDKGGAVAIGNHAWISSHSIILPRVCVGEGAVLASGALTAKNLEPFGIYAGVPAKKMGERSRDLRYEFDGNYLPFI